jgi:hypothetical protein
MSYLKKPATVVFDPSKKEHRDAVRDFMKRKAWADSKLKFTWDPAYGNIAIQVQLKLLQWYLEQEGSKEKKAAERKSAKEKIRSDNVKFIHTLGHNAGLENRPLSNPLTKARHLLSI